eukprot:1876024-Rhodomonas_salina.1
MSRARVSTRKSGGRVVLASSLYSLFSSLFIPTTNDSQYKRGRYYEYVGTDCTCDGICQREAFLGLLFVAFGTFAICFLKGNFENIHLLRAKCLRASIGKGIVLTNVRKVERNLTRKLQVARAALVIVKADLRAIYSSIRPYNYDKFRRQLIIRRNQLTRVYFQTLSSLLEAYLTLTLAELHHAESLVLLVFRRMPKRGGRGRRRLVRSNEGETDDDDASDTAGAAERPDDAVCSDNDGSPPGHDSDNFRTGDMVWFQQKNKVQVRVRVLDVHTDVQPPLYSIKVNYKARKVHGNKLSRTTSRHVVGPEAEENERGSRSTRDEDGDVPVPSGGDDGGPDYISPGCDDDGQLPDDVDA